MGLGMLLGLMSLGTSIYSAHELQQPHGELTNLRTDFCHIAHELEHEAHTVNKLAENLNTVSKSCQFILGRIEQQDAKLATMTNLLGLMMMVGNLNTQLSAWGRGLEALTEGKLHPSLIDQ